MVMDTLTEDIRLVLQKCCYREFSITFDGTPAFAEAEAVIIRVVTTDFEVLELLVKCNLFKHKLDGVQLANHIVSTIIERCGKELKDWVCAQQDRASTNKKALRLIEDKFANVKLAKNYCCSHTLSNAGKEMMGPTGSAKYAEHFRKLFQQIIQHPGKARDHTSRVFGEQVLDAGGVRFLLSISKFVKLQIRVLIKFCYKFSLDAKSRSGLKPLHKDGLKNMVLLTNLLILEWQW